MKRTAFFISDGTGITAEVLGNSLLSQFESVEFEEITLPYIDTPEKVEVVIQRINETGRQDGHRPIVFDTFVNAEYRAMIADAESYNIDIFSTFLKPLESELDTASTYTVGKSHAINQIDRYKARIDSDNFALDNDDGARTQQYKEADIILVGVSRCGKTPTCLYMALQYGIRAANYPLTEEDMGADDLPEILKQHREKLYGLTIDPFQLAAIRNERRPNSRYSSLDQCDLETRTAERYFRQNNMQSINTTNFSIEEISTRIMADANLNRRIV